MKDLSQLKVAIVCDWLVSLGGAERVVLELHKMFPDAPIYTSQYDPKKIDWFRDADVKTGWLQKLPLSLRKFLPVLRAWYFSHLDLSDYDLVISSSGAEAKAVKVKKGAVHICYMHAPTHYYWSRYYEYLAHPGFGKLDPLARLGLRLLISPMRSWDKKVAQRPNYIITNSSFTKEKIERYYHRQAEVIHPPVDVDRFENQKTPNHHRHGFVIAGRQTPYKRIDLAVVACSELNLPLLVIGNGPDHAKLVDMAGPSVKFITNADDKQVTTQFQNAEAFIFPNLDDFGIVAIEALAAGTPVIAYKAGGALDYIEPGKTGMFFNEQTVESLKDCLDSYVDQKFDHEDIKRAAEKFSTDRFRGQITKYIPDSV